MRIFSVLTEHAAARQHVRAIKRIALRSADTRFFTEADADNLPAMAVLAMEYVKMTVLSRSVFASCLSLFSGYAEYGAIFLSYV
ncbi:hypothetical protein [Undibacterium sp. WLHG33]|uniref:hypothetical protein n=1 Tax=Undibacterium sp. WLHG33 TaxID=3412482 RepID=UPI003C2F5F1B